MNKQFRQDKILQLIRDQEIFTQEDLVKGLRRMGVRATQVTLSRDLHELNVAKTSAGYKVIDDTISSELQEDFRHQEFERTMAEFLRDVKRAQNLVILKTAVGGAQPVALALDRENWPEVVGTIAGDDTILVIAGDNRNAEKIVQRLLDLGR
jgi:transcriptional regulator of arginine metabolism